MAPSALDPNRMLAWGRGLGPAVRAGLHWASHHTGLPVVVVAAVAVVLSWRAFRRMARFTVEVTLVLVLLLTATHLGWITW